MRRLMEAEEPMRQAPMRSGRSVPDGAIDLQKEAMATRECAVAITTGGRVAGLLMEVTGPSGRESRPDALETAPLLPARGQGTPSLVAMQGQ
jgi:hypothetical protein